MEKISLSNGIQIPATGFGVFRIPDGDYCASVVAEAIDAGYRMLDTAQGYWNEESVGKGIKINGIDRKEIFLATKVWMSQYGEEDTYQSVLESMDKLGTEFLDLVLLHQAMADYYGAYRALEKLYGEGRIRAIGVSNFSSAQLADLSLFCKIVPAVNQIQINPFSQKRAAEAVHRKYGVCMEAWAPLGAGNPEVLNHPVLISIAENHGKSTAQVILRWLFQRGVVTVTKSVHRERMVENLDVFNFVLSEEEMSMISTLEQGKNDKTEMERVHIIEQLKKVIERESCHFR